MKLINETFTNPNEWYATQEAVSEGKVCYGNLLDYGVVKRCFDFALALLLGIVLAVPMILIALLIKLTSRGPVLHWSNRVGRNNVIFRMPKFRTMRVGTPKLPTHLMKLPKAYLTPVGSILRKLSLDELPQLWSIARGDMSFVGPRPVLDKVHNQLIELRTCKGVHRLTPGITGWAQINGRDNVSDVLKAEYDAFYLRHHSFAFDLRILCTTCLKVAMMEGVQH